MIGLHSLLTLLLACSPNKEPIPLEIRTHDFDGDGFTEEKGDCNDDDASVYPDAEESCDGLDNNCNDVIDEDATTEFFIDIDGDGYGTESFYACETSDGIVEYGNDCSENIDDGHHANIDLPNSTQDVDCDGIAAPVDCNDEDASTVQDNDCDGVLNTDNGGDDCDDSFETGANFGSQSNDNDCDGHIPVTNGGDDCNDNDGTAPLINIDADCDAVITNEDCDDNDASMPLYDEDCDGVRTSDDCNDLDSIFGDISNDADCDGFVTIQDCNDNDATRNDLTHDQDCDGLQSFNFTDQISCISMVVTSGESSMNSGAIKVITENNESHTLSNIDGISSQACFGSSTFDLYWLKTDDMDSFTANISQDGQVVGAVGYDGVEFTFLNADNDLTTRTDSGTFHSGTTSFTNDCDDGDPNSTAVLEDGDCDTILTADDCDDNSLSLGAISNDADCDGVLTLDDCNDNSVDFGAQAVDGDCDGTLTADDCDDTDPNSTILSEDADCDGFISINDCDDDNDTIHPSATEVCDEIDNNCDGFIDENVTTIFFRDDDGDGDGTSLQTIEACIVPDNYAETNTDCNDADPAVFLGAEELCDGRDNDCDGITPLEEIDNDDDGYVECYVDPLIWRGNNQLSGGDCDDTIASFSNQGTDADCDGILTADDCDDTDPNSTILVEDADCDGVLTLDDCDDEDTSLLEILLDQDCDGTQIQDDCDDTNPNSTILAEDADCDTTVTIEDCDDNNPLLNMNDVDNDGAFTCEIASESTCYDFELFDSYGDGWNGNGLEVYEDGVLTDTIANQNLDGISSNGSAGEYNYVSYCPDGQTSTLELVFVDGSYNTEVQFDMYDSAGVLILTGVGSGSVDLIVNGVTYTNGNTIYFTMFGALSDCDDNNATQDPFDYDGDGLSSCDGDCDDGDASVYPGASEISNDGIDQDCDGVD